VHIARLVTEVTDDKSLPKQLRKQLQIDHAPYISRSAALIKVADKICNLRDLGQSPPIHWTVERKGKYIECARDVARALPISRHRMRRVFEDEYASANDK